MNADNAEQRSQELDEQDAAYERAVLEARADPTMEDVIATSFLQEDAADALRKFEASEHFSRVRRALGRESVQPGERVLELGGGRGLLSSALARAGYDVVMCEPNASLVCGAGAAGSMSRSLDIDMEIVNGPVSDLADAPPFAAVVCRAVLHHVKPLVPVLRDTFAVLRDGGLFLASDEPTIRNEAQLDVVLEEHPFVRYGVEEWAAPIAHYKEALRDAGFERVAVRFPVAFSDYRSLLRPDLAAPIAAVAYSRYRALSAIRPHPGQPRLFTAHRPAVSPEPGSRR